MGPARPTGMHRPPKPRETHKAREISPSAGIPMEIIQRLAAYVQHDVDAFP